MKRLLNIARVKKTFKKSINFWSFLLRLYRTAHFQSRVTRWLGKIGPIFQKLAKTVAEPTRCQNIYIKAQNLYITSETLTYR
jgi:hypothetical protein